MKKLTISLIIAVLGFAVTATLALAGPRHGFGHNGSEITVVGNFPVNHVGFFSNFGPPPPPPPFFPFAPFHIQKRVIRNRHQCDRCYRHNAFQGSHNYKYSRHHNRHRRDRHGDDCDNERRDGSHRNRRSF